MKRYCKVFYKILETSYQELIKKLAKSSQNLVGIFIQDLNKILQDPIHILIKI